ncbi:hypothetical protein C8R45DRAFT_935381 [Mycena sanguinolenta]|nr:hypothetical protein C8R45DRAFT_935381 [Mycena sanguinolenta]
MAINVITCGSQRRSPPMPVPSFRCGVVTLRMAPQPPHLAFTAIHTVASAPARAPPSRRCCAGVGYESESTLLLRPLQAPAFFWPRAMMIMTAIRQARRFPPSLDIWLLLDVNSSSHIVDSAYSPECSAHLVGTTRHRRTPPPPTAYMRKRSVRGRRVACVTPHKDAEHGCNRPAALHLARSAKSWRWEAGVCSREAERGTTRQEQARAASKAKRREESVRVTPDRDPQLRRKDYAAISTIMSTTAVDRICFLSR